MHSLAPYTIRVFDRSLAGPNDEKYHALDKIRGKDLLNIIKDFSDGKVKNYYEINDDKTKKILKFSDVTVKDRTVYGVIEYGEFGIKGKVINVNSGDTVYSKTKEDSDIHLLYFNFTVPNNATTGICLFHNIHGRGVKGLIDTLLNDFFNEQTKGLRVQLRPLSYIKAIEEWLKHSQIKEIRLTKFKPKTVGSDQVDQLADNHVEVTYKPKDKGGTFGSFWDFRKTKQKDGKNREAVNILSEYCSSVRAVVEFQGRKRVFTLTSESMPVSAIDFDSEDVDMDEGAPELVSLHEFSDGLIEDMLTTI